MENTCESCAFYQYNRPEPLSPTHACLKWAKPVTHPINGRAGWKGIANAYLERLDSYKTQTSLGPITLPQGRCGSKAKHWTPKPPTWCQRLFRRA